MKRIFAMFALLFAFSLISAVETDIGKFTKTETIYKQTKIQTPVVQVAIAAISVAQITEIFYLPAASADIRSVQTDNKIYKVKKIIPGLVDSAANYRYRCRN